MFFLIRISSSVSSQEFGNFRTILGVPLLREGSPIGVVVLQRAAVRPFTERQIKLVESFADQAVIAIENTRLFETEQQRTRELSESLEQQTATSEVLKVISSSPGDLKPVFDAMLANAARLCEAKFGALGLREGDAYRIVAIHNAPQAFAEFMQREPLRPSPNGTLGRAIVTKRVAQAADITIEQPYLQGDPLAVAAVELGGYRTVLAVPMLKESEIIGLIIFVRQEVRPFNDKQIALVQNFAAQAVIAIENAPSPYAVIMITGTSGRRALALGRSSRPLIPGMLMSDRITKTGKQIWKTKVEYPPETPRIVCCGIINRGAAIYDGKIFRTTLDANVIALDAATGKEMWRKNAIDFKTGYSMTVAPLVADGVVITGISGAEFGTRDFIDGWDTKTGEHLWRTYTVPGAGEPGNDTWQGDTWKLGGGSTWITGSFDPELHTVYWGIGNPGPFNAAVRPGDNLYTCSVLAKTGKIKWHYQFSPNNPFNYDLVAEIVLGTLNVDGKPTTDRAVISRQSIP